MKRRNYLHKCVFLTKRKQILVIQLSTVNNQCFRFVKSDSEQVDFVLHEILMYSRQ